MNRTVKVIRLGDNTSKCVVTLESDFCGEDSYKKRAQQRELLRLMVDNPDLLICNGYVFETLIMEFKESRWVAELSAKVTS